MGSVSHPTWQVARRRRARGVGAYTAVLVKIVICPDSFKGTLGAADAAAAMAAGWRSARPDDEVVTVPLADGGDGTLAVVASAVAGATRHTVEVADAWGSASQGDWLLLPDGTAVVEAAQAVGLARRTEAERDPVTATSYGVGQLLAAAVAAGARAITVGLGGSATVDGGAGMALALGHKLRRVDGNGVKVGARWLADLARVEPARPLDAAVDVAVDVTNPLLGPQGAARVYGPQKGASEADVAELEAVLAHLADVVERDVPGGPWRDLPGAGAAGGLGFGVAAFCGAALRSGGAWIAGLTGLETALTGCDAVVFGEGALDGQTTAHGKIGAHVVAEARRHGARLLAVAGRVDGEAAAGFDDAVELGTTGLAAPAAGTRAAARALAQRAANAGS